MATDNANTTNTALTQQKHSTITPILYNKTGIEDRIMSNLTQNTNNTQLIFSDNPDSVSVCNLAKVCECPTDSEKTCNSAVSVGISANSRTYEDNIKQLSVPSVCDNITPKDYDSTELMKIKLLIPYSEYNVNGINYIMKLNDESEIPINKAMRLIELGFAEAIPT